MAALAHLALTRAYTKADASAIIVFDYTRLPFVALIAWMLFGELADIWTWVGAGIIAGSSIYIARREAAVAREAKRKASGAAGESAKGRT
jgi:drug/metabolite transporter (DMT)-like permease